MFHRNHLFLFFALFGISFVAAWRLGIFDRPVQPLQATSIHLRTLREVNKVLYDSISAVQNPITEYAKTKPVEPVKPVETKSVEPVKPAETKPVEPVKPTPELPLPVLTAVPQDSYYGKGCKANRYRERFQKILNEWGNIVKRRNITRYFICFGSFLGSVRNGDMIPYDSDMDVCMFRHDYHKLYPEESKRPVNLNDGKIHMLLQRHSPHPKSNIPRKDCKGNIVRRVTDNCAILDPHGRLYLGALIYLDIFMIEDHGALLWDEYRDQIHSRDSILPFKPCTFLGLNTQCPNNAEKYLNVYYGKEYMKPLHICWRGKWVQNMTEVRRPFV